MRVVFDAAAGVDDDDDEALADALGDLEDPWMRHPSGERSHVAGAAREGSWGRPRAG